MGEQIFPQINTGEMSHTDHLRSDLEGFLSGFISDLNKSGFTNIVCDLGVSSIDSKSIVEKGSGRGYSSIGLKAVAKTGQDVFFKLPTRDYTAEDIALQNNEDKLLMQYEKLAKGTVFEDLAPRIVTIPGNISDLPFRAFSFINGDGLTPDKFSSLPSEQQLATIERILLLYDFMLTKMGVHDADFDMQNFKVDQKGNLKGKVDWDGVLSPMRFSEAAKGKDVLATMPIVQTYSKLMNERGRSDIKETTSTIAYITNAETIRKLLGYYIPSPGKHAKLENEHVLFHSITTVGDMPLSLKLLIAPTATPIAKDKVDDYMEMWKQVRSYNLITKNGATSEFEHATIEKIKQIFSTLNDPVEIEKARTNFNTLRWTTQLLKEKGAQIPKQYEDVFENKNADYHLAMAYLSKGDISMFKKHASIAYEGLGSIETYFMHKYASTTNPDLDGLLDILSVLNAFPGNQELDLVPAEMQTLLQQVNWAMKIIERGSRIDPSLYREDVLTIQEELDPKLFEFFDIKHQLSAKLKILKSAQKTEETTLQQRRLDIINLRIDEFMDSVSIDNPEAWDIGYNWDIEKSNQANFHAALQQGSSGQVLTAEDYLEPIKKIGYRDLSRVDRVTLRLLASLETTTISKENQYQIALKFYQLLQKPLIYRLTLNQPAGASNLKEFIQYVNQASVEYEIPDSLSNIFYEVTQELVEELNKFRPLNANNVKQLTINPEEYT